MTYRRRPITVLVSEYVEGEMLSVFLKRQPGGRLRPFQALHLLHTLVVGMECIHRLREYHGDLHTDNVIVSRYGLRFDLKIWTCFTGRHRSERTCRTTSCERDRILLRCLGGAKYYAQTARRSKTICCGLKRTLILKKFPTISHLRQHLETMEWS